MSIMIKRIREEISNISEFPFSLKCHARYLLSFRDPLPSAFSNLSLFNQCLSRASSSQEQLDSLRLRTNPLKFGAPVNMWKDVAI